MRGLHPTNQAPYAPSEPDFELVEDEVLLEDDDDDESLALASDSAFFVGSFDASFEDEDSPLGPLNVEFVDLESVMYQPLPLNTMPTG
jgi:hypothetical protein